MRIENSVQSSLIEGNEEVTTKSKILNAIKGTIVLTVFTASMLGAIIYNSDNYSNETEADRTNKVFLAQEEAENNERLLKEKKLEANLKIKPENYISTGAIIEMMGKKGYEDLSSVAKSSYLSIDTYKSVPMNTKYKELKDNKSYKNFNQTEFLNKVSNYQYYDDLIKNNKNNISNSEKLTLNKEKAIFIVKIEHLNSLNNYILEKDLKLKKDKLKKETYEKYVSIIENEKSSLSEIKNKILLSGNLNFGSQMRGIDALNIDLEGIAQRHIDIRENIKDLVVAFESKPQIQDKITKLKSKMNNLISKNKLNGSLLSVQDKEFFKNSINLLSDMEKDLSSVENTNKIISYDEKINKLNSLIGIKNGEVYDGLASKIYAVLDNNGNSNNNIIINENSNISYQ